MKARRRQTIPGHASFFRGSYITCITWENQTQEVVPMLTSQPRELSEAVSTKTTAADAVVVVAAVADCCSCHECRCRSSDLV